MRTPMAKTSLCFALAPALGVSMRAAAKTDKPAPLYDELDAAAQA
jgi:hypothetical protein